MTTVIETMTDDIRVTIDDVLSERNDLVMKITGGDLNRLPDVKELLISIYIRGFFTGAHLQAEDDGKGNVLSNEMMVEVIKARLA